MKKLFILFTILTLSLTYSVNSFAWAVRAPRYEENTGLVKGANDIFFEDFTSYEEGAIPSCFTTVYADAANPIEVAEYEVSEGKKKNVLKMVDTTSTNYVDIAVPKVDGAVTFEVRIKFKPTTTPGYGFIMEFQENGVNAFRIIKFSAANDSLCFVNSAGNNLFSRGADYNNQWFTLKVRIDPETRTTGVILENENFGEAALDLQRAKNTWHDKANKRVMAYSQQWFNEFTGKSVNSIRLQSYGSSTSGEYFIDYIKLTKDVPAEDFEPVKERAESKTVDYVAAPSVRLVPNIINLLYKDEVKYLANPITVVNGRSLVDVNNFASWYGYTVAKNGTSYELTGDKGTLTFNLNDYSFNVNGVAYTTDVAPSEIKGCVYVPVKSFANALGDEVLWQNDPKCVIIK
ncbi:MAG: copper amine oxidase N-terminal domain-containing protein [Clostridia bacterium]|nr:copper amine oxidase N-terminal domain-containing protein [Clostridia bacterium]